MSYRNLGSSWLFKELRNPVVKVTVLCDNKAAVDIFSSLKTTKTIKSLDIRDAAVRYSFVKRDN